MEGLCDFQNRCAKKRKVLRTVDEGIGMATELVNRKVHREGRPSTELVSMKSFLATARAKQRSYGISWLRYSRSIIR